jgi:hypothetical protein
VATIWGIQSSREAARYEAALAIEETEGKICGTTSQKGQNLLKGTHIC